MGSGSCSGARIREMGGRAENGLNPEAAAGRRRTGFSLSIKETVSCGGGGVGLAEAASALAGLPESREAETGAPLPPVGLRGAGRFAPCGLGVARVAIRMMKKNMRDFA